MHYIGRFAPSPTGPLHLGSLYAAVCSYLDAKSNNGKWLLRIEDIDPPREQPGAISQILKTLESHGLEWDDDIAYQSRRSEIYEQALQGLESIHAIFACPCSRKTLKVHKAHQDNCPLIDFRNQPLPFALRLKSNQTICKWDDLFLGIQEMTDQEEAVLKRKEGLYAYQLAVVCDDIDQGITHIVRGRDLLDCTPTQLHLYRLFDKTPPRIGHIPLVKNNYGQKLSKQNFAPAVTCHEASNNLLRIGRWLNLDTPSELVPPRQLLGDYLKQWSRKQIGAEDLRSDS